MEQRFAAELHTALSRKEILFEVARYFGAEAPLASAPEFQVVGGWTGDASFGVRYRGPWARLVVIGRVREHGGHATILLRFQKGAIPLLVPLAMAAAAGGLWYWVRIRVDWLSFIIPITVGLLSRVALLGRGAPAKLADAAVADLATALQAERL